MNMCGLNVLCGSIDHIYVYLYTHMYDNLINIGALGRCSQEYPKLDGDLHILYPCERTSHMI